MKVYPTDRTRFYGGRRTKLKKKKQNKKDERTFLGILGFLLLVAILFTLI
jgi:hypothetical protein